MGSGSAESIVRTGAFLSERFRRNRQRIMGYRFADNPASAAELVDYDAFGHDSRLFILGGSVIMPRGSDAFQTVAAIYLTP